MLGLRWPLALGTGAVIGQIPGILLQTVTMTAMLYLIIIGHVFGPFLALTHIPETLALERKELGLGPMAHCS